MGVPDDMRSQYLKELLRALREVDVSPFYIVLAGVDDLMLQGSGPSTICKVIHEANLFAFCKRCGGIRPVALDFALRRLVSRIVATRLRLLSEDTRPNQLGFCRLGRSRSGPTPPDRSLVVTETLHRQKHSCSLTLKMFSTH